MLYKKYGMPEENSLVLCTITKIYHNSVFANLDEFSKQGMIHISEISPGRIRNISDYVKEGKKVICKVLRIDKTKGHIDLSLRRVNEMQKRKKMDAIKQEQKSEKIIEFIAKKKNLDFKKLYKDISSRILEKYEYIHECFKDLAEDNLKLEEIGIKRIIAKELKEEIIKRIKPSEVEIKGVLSICSYEPDGIEAIKKALKKAQEFSKEMIIKYTGSGKYSISIKAPDYKKAEEILEKSTNEAIAFMEKSKGTASFAKK